MFSISRCSFWWRLVAFLWHRLVVLMVQVHINMSTWWITFSGGSTEMMLRTRHGDDRLSAPKFWYTQICEFERYEFTGMCVRLDRSFLALYVFVDTSRLFLYLKHEIHDNWTSWDRLWLGTIAVRYLVSGTTFVTLHHLLTEQDRLIPLHKLFVKVSNLN